MIRTAIYCCLVAACATAQAQDFGVHLGTWHSRPGMEGVNPGVYVRNLTKYHLTTGVVRNSEGRLSIYAGKVWETDDGRFALTVGVITGYKGQTVSPLVTPSVKVGDFRISVLPKPPKRYGHSWGIHLSYEF